MIVTSPINEQMVEAIIRKGVVSMEASKSEAGKKNWEQDSLEIGATEGN